jgi:hypothetical protein
MTRSSIVASVALAISWTITSVAVAGCPDRLEGKFDAPPYRFTYESWLAAKQGKSSNLAYQFGGAIHNRGADPIWIDWKEMNLSGFVPANKSKDFEIGDPTGECDIIDADIWYGDRPFLLSKVSAIRPQSKGFVAKIIQIVTDKILEYVQKDGKVFTTSNSTLYVPLDQGTELAAFQIRFTTEISKGDYKLGLSLTPDPDDRGKIRKHFEQKSAGEALFVAVFGDPFISQGLQSNDLSYTKSNFEREQPASVYQSVELKEARIEAYRTARLMFEDADGRRIGSMPVAILQPALPPRSNR